MPDLNEPDMESRLSAAYHEKGITISAPKERSVLHASAYLRLAGPEPMPNWWWRLWYWVLLGWKWERL
jgi:hypothetical protein